MRGFKQGTGITCVLPNEAVLVTAALLRMLLNVKGHGWAAARDGER